MFFNNYIITPIVKLQLGNDASNLQLIMTLIYILIVNKTC